MEVVRGDARRREAPRNTSIITDVFPYEGQCAMHVDHQGSEFRVCWTGDWWKCPDLSTFPHLVGATATEIPHGPITRHVWSTSRVIGHGADAHIRHLQDCEDDEFPIVKIGINTRQKRLIVEEFRMLRHLATLAPSAHIPLTHPEPLLEGDHIIGFKMERLHSIPLGGHLNHFVELADAVRQLNSIGVVHYDLSPNNIMLNTAGRITLIDFGHAGYLGQPIPADKVKPGSAKGARYSADDDTISLARLHSTWIALEEIQTKLS